MSFIKAVFADGTIEILNLTHIKAIEIEEVKEKLLKLCDD